MNRLIERIMDERKHHIDGGIYHLLQIKMAYNSNHIEGSKLTEEQTRYIYETKTISGENINVDDMMETVNHFRCFDMVLDNWDKPIDEQLIKDLHRCLKEGTFSSQSKEAVIGDYKKYANFVGNITTSLPENVHKDISELLENYSTAANNFDNLLDFHVKFERIHPFYDGNGRVGRLILFKECLKNNIVPFIIEDVNKAYYYRGLKEWDNERGYLRDTCLLEQDQMKEYLKYFDIDGL